jgi:hypothetical protein
LLKFKKLTFLVLAVFALTLCFGFGTTPANADVTLSDISGHWAQNQIVSLVGKNVISGYPDNTFKPDNPVTRAEFMVMTNRAFSFTNTADINYTDVKSSDWFAPEVAKAQAAGYISGFPDGSMKPNNQISRQEAASMLARALQLDTTVANPLNFTDADSIPAWSKNAIAAMVKANCISGYPDGSFKPANSISRAEAAVMIGRAMEAKITIAVYDTAGTYGPATGKAVLDGNVTISASGVILQNTEINGNLLIAESVGNGDVTLKNVTVKGTTTVKGGGKNSIIVEDCSLGTVDVNKAGGNVRIVISGNTTVVQVTLASGAILEESNLTGTGFAGITITTNGEVILNGNFASVTIEGANANVNIAGGTIAELNIASTATGTDLNIAKGATVTTLTVDATTNITGSGKIENAYYNADTTTTIEAKNIETAEGVEVSKGSSSGGGGGGGGGGGPSTSETDNLEAWINNLQAMIAVYGIYSDNFTVQLGNENTPTTITVKDTIKENSFDSLIMLAINKISSLPDGDIKNKLVSQLATDLKSITVTQSGETKELNKFIAGKLEGKPHSATAYNYFIDPTITTNFKAMQESLKNNIKSYTELETAFKEILPLDKNVNIPELTIQGLRLTKINIKIGDKSVDFISGQPALSINEIRTQLGLPAAESLKLSDLDGSSITWTFTGNSDHNYTFNLNSN